MEGYLQWFIILGFLVLSALQYDFSKFVECKTDLYFKKKKLYRLGVKYALLMQRGEEEKAKVVYNKMQNIITYINHFEILEKNKK